MSQELSAEILKEKANAVIALAMSKGADTAKAVTQWQHNHKVTIRSGEIEELAQSEGISVELVVSKDQRRASVGSCDLGQESLESMVDQAMALCRFTDQDPYYSLPKKEYLATSAMDLDLFDPSIDELSTPRRIELASELEAKMLAHDSRLKTNGAGLNSVRGVTAMANSLGFNQVGSESLVNLTVGGFAEDEVDQNDLNSGRKQSSGWGSMSRFREDILSLDEIAEQAAHQILRKLGARKPKTGKFPVYYEPKIARSLWSNLLRAASGTSIFRKQSYLTQRINTSVAIPGLHIEDVPHIPRGLGSRSYDNEGVTSKQSFIVKDGVLQTYLLSTYSANKLGLESTGHAGGCSNVRVTPGELDEAAMLKEMGTGLWVTSLLGRGTNLSTGDYSHGALGLWVENGEVAYPVMEFTINGNLDNMFRNIVCIGNNTDDRGSIITPGVVIGELMLSGT